MMSGELPKLEDFYLPTLQALEALGDSGLIEEIENRVIETCKVPPEQLEARYEKSGSLIIQDRLSWARSWLKIGGLVQSEGKGLWVLTEKGREVLPKGDHAVREVVRVAANEYNRMLQLKKAEAKAAKLESLSTGAAPDDSAWDDLLLAKLQTIDPSAFERLCQLLLRKAGFSQVVVTGKTGDGGIDGKGVVRVNLVSFQIIFQCKRYQGSVGSSTIRDFRGAMTGRADKGLVITTGTFTPDARKEATRDGAPAIDLIDGQALCQLLKDNRLGVSVEMVEQVNVDASFFDEV